MMQQVPDPHNGTLHSERTSSRFGLLDSLRPRAFSGPIVYMSFPIDRIAGAVRIRRAMRLLASWSCLLAILACAPESRGRSGQPSQSPGDGVATRPAPTVDTTSASGAAGASPPLLPQPPTPPVSTRWEYRVSEHEMGGQLRTAATASLETFELGFPYQRPQRGQLTIRQHPRDGLDVMVSIERGQIICDDYRGNRLQVRFGDRSAQRWRCSGTASGDSTLVFMAQPDRFLTELRRVEEVRIELLLYREGNQVLRFDVRGLEWETPRRRRGRSHADDTECLQIPWGCGCPEAAEHRRRRSMAPCP